MSGHFASNFPESGSVDYSDQSTNIDDTTIDELRQLAARYPQPRSALLPMLHLVQSVDGRVSPRGIEVCADVLGITTAQVSGVATFYTMYKRRPAGEHHVGVCTTALCGRHGRRHPLLALPSERLGIDEARRPRRPGLPRAARVQRRLRLRPGHDGQLGVLRQHDPESASTARRAAGGEEVKSTRGATLIRVARGRARARGFPDGRADEGPSRSRLDAGPGSRSPREQLAAPASRQAGQERPPSDRSADPRPHRPLGRARLWKLARYEAPAATARCARRSACSPTRSSTAGQGGQPARPRRRRLPDRHEVELRAAGQPATRSTSSSTPTSRSRAPARTSRS
jgi:NADH-quinone oxidoreductase subunit E